MRSSLPFRISFVGYVWLSVLALDALIWVGLFALAELVGAFLGARP